MGRPRKNARQRFKAPNGSKWPPTFKLGWFTAAKICLEEVAINDVILRVPLKPYTDLEPKRKRGRPPLVQKHVIQYVTKSNVGRGVKREINTWLQKPKRKRPPLVKKRLIQYVTKLNVGRGLKRGIHKRFESGTTNGPSTNQKRENRTRKMIQQRRTNLRSEDKSRKNGKIERGTKRKLVTSVEGTLDLKEQPLTLKRLVTNLKSSEVESRFRNGKRRIHLPAVKRSTSLKLNKLTFGFEKLCQCLDEIRFPSPEWKVSVIMNYDLKTEIRFYNTVKPKSVSFSEKHLKIAIDKVPVVLLGCPKTVESLRDIEILLEIVNRLDLRDCMVARM
ncbi:uncharacterized protein LOC123005136 [Tribolium madens]|uniref:uncharacterized protein LOC123005136 n=1 Tax=Tribolium madens TaxID=41895 RepID=UPI001CF74D14|nr:uncharacterized protein LOC123005136 [Tribolium madens]